MKLSNKTCCWICRRNWSQLKKSVETFWESGEMTKNRGIEAFFEIIAIEKRVSGNKMRVPVCVICSELIVEFAKGCLTENLEIDRKKL